MLTEGIEHVREDFVNPREMAKSLGLTVERLGRIIRERKLPAPIAYFSKSRRVWYTKTAVAVYRAIKYG